MTKQKIKNTPYDYQDRIFNVKVIDGDKVILNEKCRVDDTEKIDQILKLSRKKGVRLRITKEDENLWNNRTWDEVFKDDSQWFK